MSSSPDAMTDRVTTATIVVPCYNEARRLDRDAFRSFFAEHPEIDFLFVNDGSRDNTLEILEELRRDCPERVAVHSLERNSGKAEAVRNGMVIALAGPARFVAYWDADLATPLEAIPLFIDILASRPDIDLVIGSRVSLLGRRIERSPVRHYLGRIAATLASWTLGLSVYDTQCGAKMFRSTGEAREIFATPFATHWIFDIELLARMIERRRRLSLPAAETVVYELPLMEWRDVRGSKVKGGDFLKSFLELFTVRRRYLRQGK